MIIIIITLHLQPISIIIDTESTVINKIILIPINHLYHHCKTRRDKEMKNEIELQCSKTINSSKNLQQVCLQVLRY